ncbi:SRPBCC family protein [Pseudomonas cichorii]|uniref:SRPBCC family protein n=1 Tax=Pseudomonas cichorii TaxID=36746 RepID=UPI001C8A1C63|nr:SRPBCC family protein [Pseudomonas cichorii]MBX8487737.1 SRPBCC family protein [Pseudomonas cichorii]MBX8517620.1 SRPBCC family protein [Pseudomonas cichorii]MBX8532127.1 SRPBCC family protein [Pseudomonas cichorii]
MSSINTLQPDTLIKNPSLCKVVSAVEIPADANSVWAIVGNFGGFQAFIPALESTEVTGKGVRSVRKKLFKDGNVAIEQLNSHDNNARFMTWSLIYTSLPVGNLWAAMTVESTGDNDSVATWTIIAEPDQGGPEALPGFQEFLQGFADSAMSNVRSLFA